MIFTDNPIADFNRYERENEKRLAKLPTCSICGYPIQQERAVCYNNEWCCEDCEYDFFRNTEGIFWRKQMDFEQLNIFNFIERPKQNQNRIKPTWEVLNMDCLEYMKNQKDSAFDVTFTSPPL